LAGDIVELTDVSVDIGGRKIIDNFSWRVKRGEHWVIVGPNGAGKTTLLRVLNGYQWPSSGKATVLSTSFGSSDLRELRKEIGFVSAYIGDCIPDELKVEDVVMTGAYASIRLWSPPRSGDLARAKALLRRISCAKHAKKSFGQLSQGEKQRVIIARALMARPSLLTLDEPCAELDLTGRESFLSTLAKIATRKTPTMIYVTHRIEEVPRGFTHALLLKDGRALDSGRIEAVFNKKSLSSCFGVKVDVRKWRNRFYAFVDG
jgi:iron complex transport system ATP-binding protein